MYTASQLPFLSVTHSALARRSRRVRGEDGWREGRFLCVSTGLLHPDGGVAGVPVHTRVAGDFVNGF